MSPRCLLKMGEAEMEGRGARVLSLRLPAKAVMLRWLLIKKIRLIKEKLLQRRIPSE